MNVFRKLITKEKFIDYNQRFTGIYSFVLHNSFFLAEHPLIYEDNRKNVFIKILDPELSKFKEGIPIEFLETGHQMVKYFPLGNIVKSVFILNQRDFRDYKVVKYNGKEFLGRSTHQLTRIIFEEELLSKSNNSLPSSSGNVIK